jgi:RNA polymerase sigma-70 factor (ECF subfamily)
MRRDLVQALEILRRCEPDAVEKALAQLQDTVFSFSMKLCGNREDAQDTMQETLVRVIPYLHRFEHPEALALWLYKVAKTRCLMSRRKSKFAPRAIVSLDELRRSPRGSHEPEGKTASSPEAQFLRRERREHLQQAVLKLPPPYRLPLILHDMEGLSTRQTAEVLTIREGTVRVRLHRARLFLRDELARVFARGARAIGQPRAPSPPCRKLIAECSRYLDEELDGSLCKQLEKHLDGCAPCRAFLATLQRVVEECRRHRPGGGRPRMTDRARKLLLEKYRAAATELGRANR